MSKNLCPSAWGGDVSLLTAASPHKAWLLQLHAQGAIQSREVVSRDTAAPSCRHQRPRYKSDRGLEAAHSVGTVTGGQMAVWYWYLSVWFWPGSLAADTAAGERLGCLGLQLLPGDLSLSQEQLSIFVAAGGAANPILLGFPHRTFCLGSVSHSQNACMQFLPLLLQSLELDHVLSVLIAHIRYRKLQAKFIPCATSPQPS